MAYLLGIDTGGTYTDAVVLDDTAGKIIASAKALTSRPDLAQGVGAAIDAALAKAGIAPAQIAMASLSTTLATNALVEGQGGRIGFIAIGFDAADLSRAGLQDALGDDPVIAIAGGHDHGGAEKQPLDLAALQAGLAAVDPAVTAFAVAGSFAARNPAHEKQVRDLVQSVTGKPVTCGHDLSQALGGPKRALTAVLNARLVGMIDRLITACEAHLAGIGSHVPLMVVRGDGALISADVARRKPIETILSGPAASVAGASWLTGMRDAFVSDIGGTTTDICLLRDGKPQIDPQGAQVGPFRTMVAAVAMRTTGLGGDSAVHLADGLAGGLTLGPRRVMPVSLAATQFPDLVHGALDAALAQPVPPLDGCQFAVPLWSDMPQLAGRDAAVAARLAAGPLRLGQAAPSRPDMAALERLVARGYVMLAGVTPSDAAHVLGHLAAWDGDAAQKALTLLAMRRAASGQRIAPDAATLAQMIVDRLTVQTATCLLQAAFAEAGWDDPQTMATHPLTQAGLDHVAGPVNIGVSLGLPVIALGASAATYYGAVGDRLGTPVTVPDHAGVANAVGAVVGQVSMRISGTVTSDGGGRFIAHTPDGPQGHASPDAALAALEAALSDHAAQAARKSGVADPAVQVSRTISQAEVEGQATFISAEMTATATGRPRIAVSPA